MRLFRPLLPVFLSMLVVIGLRGLRISSLPSRAAEVKENIYIEYAGDYEDIVDAYHEKTNTLFNDRIADLVRVASDGSKEDLIQLVNRVRPPDFEPNAGNTSRVLCKAENQKPNLSTYCLAQEVLANYVQFRSAMRLAQERKRESIIDDIFEEKPRSAPMIRGSIGNSVRGLTIGVDVGEVLNAIEEAVSSSNSETLPQKGPDIYDVQKGSNTYEETLAAIERELALARDAMDQGLAAYDELQMALPLHMKYLETIKALEDYRDNISKIRKEVDTYPGTFLDVTTTSCN